MTRIAPLKGVILDHTVIDAGSSPPMIPAAFIEGSESPWSDQPLIDLDSGTLNEKWIIFTRLPWLHGCKRRSDSCNSRSS